MLLKRSVYDKLVAELNVFDISGLALKTKYDTGKSDLEKKISDADIKIPVTSGLAKKADYNAKITEIESKIPSISGLATTPALNAVNIVPDGSNLVKKRIMTQKYQILNLNILLQQS